MILTGSRQIAYNNQQLLFVKVPMESYQHELEIYKEDNWHVLNYSMNNDDEESGFFGDIAGYTIELQPGDYIILGSIQKENGVVSTTILDEALKELSNFKALDGLPVDRADLNLISIVEQMEDSGIPLQEGNKYVVLKIK